MKQQEFRQFAAAAVERAGQRGRQVLWVGGTPAIIAINHC